MCVCVHEIISQCYLVHAVHPVKRKVIAGLQVAAHPQKTREGMIDPIVKRSSIQRVLALVAEEVLMLAGLTREFHRHREVPRLLIRLVTPAQVDAAQ